MDSFSAKIGVSIKVKPRIIIKEKGKKQYKPYSSYINHDIFVADDPDDENGLIIYMEEFFRKKKIYLFLIS